MTPDYRAIFEALDEHDVDFVVIGAVALVLHGSARVTRDLDVCYSRERANLERLAQALKSFAPTLRGAPASLPFTLDAPTLRAGLNFTLQSSAGDLGLGRGHRHRRVSGGEADVPVMRVYEHHLRVLSLDGLERPNERPDV